LLVDSHCHIDFPECAGRIEEILANMEAQGVAHALCVSVNLEDYPRVRALSERFANVYASVGVHPDHQGGEEPSMGRLMALADHPRVVAIGETGLDYYRHPELATVQQARFREHIRAARGSHKPLIVHTRDAAADTLRLMREESASEVGGVMHCFTESWEVAEAAVAMNFYVSFSGIVTFKNAVALKEVARRLPLERLLIETDSPYLAPVPYRGRANEPGFVRHVAEKIGRIRGMDIKEVERVTTRNFFSLFTRAGELAAGS